MTDLFEHAAAQAAKVAGMARAEKHATPEWSAFMFEIGVKVATRMAEFTTNDLIVLYNEHPNPPKTHDWRALGPVMNKLAKAGYCRKTDRVLDSHRASRHSAPIAIWRGKLK